MDVLEGGERGGYAACGIVGAEFEAGCAGEEGEVGRGGVEDCYFEHFRGISRGLFGGVKGVWNFFGCCSV